MAIQPFPQPRLVRAKTSDAHGMPQETETMASNKYVFCESAMNKIREFQNLAYPNTILKGACTFLAATTGNGAWMGVKRHIR